MREIAACKIPIP